MSEVPKLERFNKKQVLRNDQFLFILHEKNEFFKLTEGYPPRPVSGNYDKKNIFLQWKPIKLMNMFTGDLYSMYVVLQGIESPSCIIIKYVIPFG